uniref:Uncharacterized protein n=1 Tax=Romanomermis culicivorax TaxID=13658 RepID=A0A915IWC6_ROMCU
MKTRMQSVAKKQSVFPSTRKKRGDDHDGKSIAIGTSLMTEAVPSPPPTVFPKKTGAIKVLDTESVTSTTDPSRTVVSQPKSRRKLAKGEQTTFDFLTPKGTRSTRYATSTRRPGAKGSHIVPCMCLIVLFVMLVGALVVWMFGATTSEKKITSSTSTIIMSSIASTTTDLPPIEIAIPVEFETSTTTTVSTTTVTYTTAVKRPPLNDGAWKEACGSPCWYHPGKFATSCQSIECHSVRLFVGQGLRGQANYSFYVIKQSAPLTRKSTSVPEVLKPKYTDLCSPRSSSKICYPFMAGFRSCTKKHPANGGKHCFQIDRLSGWLKIDDKYSPVGIRACPLCKDKHKWPPARPLDFKPDCNHVFHDEFFCHLAYGDFSDGDKDSLAVSDFDYCCIGRELGRCLLGTCTPLI